MKNIAAKIRAAIKGIAGVFAAPVTAAATLVAEFAILAIGVVSVYFLFKLLAFAVEYFDIPVGDFSLGFGATWGLIYFFGFAGILLLIALIVAAFFGIRALWKKVRQDARDNAAP